VKANGLGGVAIALFVLVAAGCGTQERSGTGRQAAQAACRQFVAEVEPYRFGVGVAQLADQAKGFRAARARLADELRQAAQPNDGLRALTSLADDLVAGNRLLAEAEQIARALAQSGGGPDTSSLVGAMKAFEHAAKREEHRAVELGLPECADPAR
jgi:hypothetical protein